MTVEAAAMTTAAATLPSAAVRTMVPHRAVVAGAWREARWKRARFSFYSLLLRATGLMV
jgi:hypothetical protein